MMFPTKPTSPSQMSIAKYLSPSLITLLDVESRDLALKQLVDLLASKGKLKDQDAFYKAILDRENIVSTGVGMGVAVPHAKLPGYDSFFIAIGVHPGGIAWGSLDGMPVRLVFMIGGPDDRQTEYLQLLSRLTFAIKDDERRKKMLQLTDPKEMMALFKGV